jgi:hypothetical protein
LKPATSSEIQAQQVRDGKLPFIAHSSNSQEDRNMTTTNLFAVLAALALSACATAPAPAASVTRVVSTTSFGMCIGYCTTRLEITEHEAVLIREPRGGRGGAINHHAQPQRHARPLSETEWRDIQRLAAQTDLTAVPNVVGCPDCADGGAETLTIEGPSGAESVSLEFRAQLPAAQALLDRVRALREELTPIEPGPPRVP